MAYLKRTVSLEIFFRITFFCLENLHSILYFDCRNILYFSSSLLKVPAVDRQEQDHESPT